MYCVICFLLSKQGYDSIQKLIVHYKFNKLELDKLLHEKKYINYIGASVLSLFILQRVDLYPHIEYDISHVDETTEKALSLAGIMPKSIIRTFIFSSLAWT